MGADCGAARRPFPRPQGLAANRPTSVTGVGALPKREEILEGGVSLSPTNALHACRNPHNRSSHGRGQDL
jgi:hypothetical protein